MSRYIVDYIDGDGKQLSIEVNVADDEGTADAGEKVRSVLTAGSPSAGAAGRKITGVREIPSFQSRLNGVIEFLGRQFSCGNMSVSVDDEMDDGGLLSDEIETVIDESRRLQAAGRPPVIAALEILAEVWGSGYDIASGSDFVTDHDTVADLVEQHLSPSSVPVSAA